MSQNTIAILVLLGIGAFVLFMSNQNKTSLPKLTPMRYVNEERTEIKRDSAGRITELIIHRDAKQYN